MKTYWRLLSYTKPVTQFALPFFVTSFLASAFGILNIALLIPTLNVLFEITPTEVPDAPLPFRFSIDNLVSNFNYYAYNSFEAYGKLGQLYFICAVIFTSVLLSNVFRYLNARILERLKARSVANIRKEAFNNAVQLPLQFFSEERKGNIMSRLTTDMAEVEFSITQSFKGLLKEPFTLILSFIALFAMSVKMTLFAIVFIPLSGGLVAFIVRKLRRVSKESQEALANIVSLLDESFGGIRIIKAFNAEGYIKDRFTQENNRYKASIKSGGYRRELSSPVSEFMGVTIIVCTVLYGGSLILTEGNTSGLQAAEFFGFIGILSRITQPIKEISNMFGQIQRGLVSAKRIFELVDRKNPIISQPNAKVIGNFEKEIVFQEVGFSYDGVHPVLHQVNLTLKKGETVALVGASGGGKSTIADLVPRFYDPTEGQILLDDHPLTAYNVQSVRALMGVVTQQSILFNDTIFNNIAFGEEATLEKVIQAAKIANAHDFIMALPAQYETNIGDRGSKLSGGQQQRISIARAVLKNPPILILDEATSSLDTESEKLVQDALVKLMKNRTSLVIAHRLSTIQHADKILVIHQGRIIEEGNHKRLLRNENGVYTKLPQAQRITDSTIT